MDSYPSVDSPESIIVGVGILVAVVEYALSCYGTTLIDRASGLLVVLTTDAII